MGDTTMSLEKFLNFKSFNWEQMLKISNKHGFRIVTYCTYNSEEHDPLHRNRITMNAPMFLALIWLKPEIPSRSLESMFRRYNISDRFKIIEKFKELSLEAYNTAPQSVRREKSTWEINFNIQKQRYLDLHPQYGISIAEEGGRKFISEEGKIKLFHSEDAAVNYLILKLESPRGEIRKMIKNKELFVEVYQ